MENSNPFDDGIKYHPLENIDMGIEIQTSKPSVYNAMTQKHDQMPEHHIYRRKSNIQNEKQTSKRSVYDAMTQKHDQIPEHQIYRRKGNIQNEEQINDINSQSEHHEEVKIFMKTALKKGATYMVDETEIVSESLEQHKYARLANSSYDYFNSKGKIESVHYGLNSSDFEYISDLKGFRVDTEMSTIDNLVLYNSQTGETHISYRGTTDNPMRTKTFLNDWKTNGEITGGSTHSTRVRHAERQFDKVVTKYGKQKLSVSGHSQGGHVSYEIATRHDITGHHFNPAINTTQIKDAPKYVLNESEQIVYKTAVDFASPLAYNKKLKISNTEVKIINNLKGKDGIIETHSIDQFAPKPTEIKGALIKAERRTLAGSVVKSTGKLLEIANVGYAVYEAGKEIDDDLNNKDSNALEKVFDVGIDTTKNVEKFVVDNTIADIGLGLAGETLGASVVVSIGAIMVNDFVTDHVADGAKSVVRQGEQVTESVMNTVEKAANNIKHFFGF